MRIIERNIAGAFVFSSDNKVLLGKAGVYDGQWVVPGGGIEEGESELEAARREVLEESGVDINLGEITPVQEDRLGESEKELPTGERVLVKMRFFDFIVRMPIPAEEIHPVAGDDFKEVGLFSSEDFAAMDLANPTKLQLQKLGFLPSE